MQDLRLAIRALRSTPIVTTVAILSLALGIGANTAIFSLINSLLLRPLPVAEPQRLAVVSGPTPNQMWSYVLWDEIRQRSQLFDGACAWAWHRLSVAQRGELQPVDGLFANGDFFTTLGEPTLLGRTFSASDDARGGGPDGPVTVISYAFWQRRFGGAAGAVGATIVINQVPFTIIGVTPPGFYGPEVGRSFDIAVPIGTEPLLSPPELHDGGGRNTALDNRNSWWLNVMLRLRPTQSIEQAATALRGVAPQVRQAAMPPEERAPFISEPFTLTRVAAKTSALRQQYERPLVTIFVVVALVLLIACANIANLLLARATARRHELSVRVALGASRWRLARQSLAESLLLAVLGAAVGLLFALWSSPALVSQLSTQVNPVYLDLSIDWSVLAFTTLVMLATAVLFGTGSAIRATRVAPIDALKEHGHSAAGHSRATVANGLVVAQVALSLGLVVAAGLFVQTFARLADLPLGFQADRILVVNVANASRGNQSQRLDLFQHLAEAVAGVPGVAHAGASGTTPLSGSVWGGNHIEVSGAPPLPERESTALVNFVTPGWFATYGTRLVAGRDIDPHDTANTSFVTVVNEAFVHRFFPGRNALGGSITQFPSRSTRTIVGVVGDAVYASLRGPVTPTMYIPLLQWDWWDIPLTGISIGVRSTAGSPVLLTRNIAAMLTDVDRNLTFSFRPLADQVNASLTQERLVAMVSGFFGVLALLLAGLGLYGVTSYAVTRRRTEIGIRMALGAEPAGVVRLVIARVSVLVGLGVLAGVGLSWWASTFVATLLYGVEPRDPVTLMGAAGILAAVGAFAGWLPAWRASRIDPAEVLRDG